MTRRLIPLLALLAPGLAASQSSSAAYTEYATAITTTADSAVGFLTAQVDSLPDATAVGMLADGAARMARFTSAFAAVEPPAGLAGVHREMVAALTLAAGKAERAVTLMRTGMDSSSSDEQRTTAAETAQQELRALQTSINAYQTARAQAARLLRQHGVTLAAPD
jgi:hypothetical protein